jgi:hypothetical protein
VGMAIFEFVNVDITLSQDPWDSQIFENWICMIGLRTVEEGKVYVNAS